MQPYDLLLPPNVSIFIPPAVAAFSGALIAALIQFRWGFRGSARFVLGVLAVMVAIFVAQMLLVPWTYEERQSPVTTLIFGTVYGLGGVIWIYGPFLGGSAFGALAGVGLRGFWVWSRTRRQGSQSGRVPGR